MTHSISAAARDALYRRAIDQLNGFDDLLRAAEDGDIEAAYRIGRRMLDSLRLIQEELGWGPAAGGDCELGRIPQEDLMQILNRIREDASLQYESQLPELKEVRGPVEETALIRDTCSDLVDALRRHL